jgi:hypothetical protein
MPSSESTPSSEDSPKKPSKNNPDAPGEVRKRIRRLKKEVDSAYIQLGRDLYLVYHRRLFNNWGHDSFTDYVEMEVGISQSRADRLRRIWTVFIKQLGLKPAKLSGVGYTNAHVLLTLVGKKVIDEKNIGKWLEEAKTKSYRELEQAATKAKSASAAAALESAGVPVETVHPAPTDPGDSSVTDANLDDVVGDPPSASEDVPTEDPSDPRRGMKFRLHPSQYKVVDAAIAEAKRSKPEEMADNEALANVATEFLAARMSKEEKPLARVSFILSTLEGCYGGKFVWIKDDEAATVLAEAMNQHPDLFDQPVDDDEGYDEEYVDD